MLGLRARAVVDGCSTAAPPPRVHAMLIGVRPRVRQGKGGLHLRERRAKGGRKGLLRRRLGPMHPRHRAEGPPAVSSSRHGKRE